MQKSFSKRDLGLVLLLALPFFLVGVGVTAFMAVMPVARLADSQTWVECEAVIAPESVKLVKASGSKGGATYRAAARFSYTAPDGSNYVSDQVSFSRGSDSSYSRHKLAHQKLERMSAAPAVCYVNPRDASDAVLFREMNESGIVFGALFGFVFYSIGAYLIVAGLRMSRRSQEDADVGRGVVRAHVFSKNDTFLAAIPIALNIGLFCACLKLAPGAGPWMRLLLLPAFVSAVFAFHSRRVRSNFGDISLAPDERFRVGGAASGEIKIVGGQPGENMILQIKCARITTSGKGKSKHVTRKILWESDGIVSHVTRYDGIASLRFRVSLPGNLPPSGSQGAAEIKWKLTLEAKDRKIGSRVSFDLDVGSASETILPQNAAPSAAAAVDPQNDKQLLENNGIMFVRPISGAFEIWFPSEKECAAPEGMRAEERAAFGELIGPVVFTAVGCFFFKDVFSDAGLGKVRFMFVGFFAFVLMLGVSGMIAALRKIRKEYSRPVLAIERNSGATLYSEYKNKRKVVARIPDVSGIKISNRDKDNSLTGQLYIHTSTTDALLLTRHLRTPAFAKQIAELATEAIRQRQ